MKLFNRVHTDSHGAQTVMQNGLTHQQFIAWLEEHIAELTRNLAAKQAQVADVDLTAVKNNILISKLEDKVAELKKQIVELKRRPQQPVLTASDYRKLQFCLHPDRVAAFNDAGITARYTEAFKWLAGMKDAVAD
jgi:hypothetical protein